MNLNNSNPVPLSDPAWLALGELILPAGEPPEGIISQQLPEILLPLQLTGDFLDQIILAAQGTATRTIESHTKTPAGSMSLRFYIPLALSSTGFTWGFFSVVKNKQSAKGSDMEGVSINFYLYMEGE